VYDRVNKWGGAERVLLALHEMFPKAPLYTSVYDPKNAPWAEIFPKVIPSFLQKIPVLRSFHELLGVFTPIAFEMFDFSFYDLVISVSSEAAKGIITAPSTTHVCYCLTPTRYLWNDYKFYKRHPQFPLKYIPFYKYISAPFLSYARFWDRTAAKRPDKIISISSEVKKRVMKYYKRDSQIIFPPVELEKFRVKGKVSKGSYFLIVSRLIPYKRVDLAIKAFNKLNLPLVIVGTGSEERYLKRIASSNIFFAGYLTDNELASYYQNTRALIMPQEEDFGIVSIEAQSAGVPVIAFGKGGALDTVVDGVTGVLFEKQKVSDLVRAVRRFEKIKFYRKKSIRNAQRFSKQIFISRLKDAIEDARG